MDLTLWLKGFTEPQVSHPWRSHISLLTCIVLMVMLVIIQLQLVWLQVNGPNVCVSEKGICGVLLGLQGKRPLNLTFLVRLQRVTAEGRRRSVSSEIELFVCTIPHPYPTPSSQKSKRHTQVAQVRLSACCTSIGMFCFCGQIFVTSVILIVSALCLYYIGLLFTTGSAALKALHSHWISYRIS